MRVKPLLATLAAALVVAACNAGDATAPTPRPTPAAPHADGNGQLGSGGFAPTPPGDSTGR